MDGAPATIVPFALPAIGGCALYVALRLERPEALRLVAIGVTAAAFAAMAWTGEWAGSPTDARSPIEATASRTDSDDTAARIPTDVPTAPNDGRAEAQRLAGAACIVAAVIVVAARRTIVSAIAFLALALGLAAMLMAQGAQIAATGAVVILAGGVAMPLLVLVKRLPGGAASGGGGNGLEAEPLLACVAGALLAAVLAGSVHLAFAEKSVVGDSMAAIANSPASSRAADGGGNAEAATRGSFTMALFGGRTMLAEAVAVLYLVTAAGVVLVLRRDEGS
ncbi:MAG: hypothetical protein WD066_06570 [Planctomycetaceae bacterium]